MLVINTFLKLLRSRALKIALKNAPQPAKFYYTSSSLSYKSSPSARGGFPQKRGEEGDTTAVKAPSGDIARLLS